MNVEDHLAAAVTPADRFDLDLPMGDPDVGPTVPEALRALTDRPMNGHFTLRETPASGEAAASPDVVWQELLRFHLSGRRPEGAASTEGLLPAPLAPYHDARRLRLDYPVCLPGPAGTAAGARLVWPLSDVVDAVAARLPGEGDAREAAARALVRVEAALRAAPASDAGGRLSDAWAQAADAVLAESRPEKRAALRGHLSALRTLLPVDGPLFSCTPPVLPRLLHAAWRDAWGQRTQAFREELAGLVAGLERLLDVDASQAPQARQAAHLAASVGGDHVDDIDFDAFAHLLQDVDTANPLPAPRRARLQATLRALRAAAAFLDAEGEADTPLADVTAAHERAVALRQAFTGFFRAVYVARLERDNRYRPERHDARFEGFGWEDLSAAEQALCPPVLLYLDARTADAAEAGRLLDLLAGDLPLKAVVALDRPAGAPEGVPVPGWAGRLAAMAVALHHPFVLQTTLSAVRPLADGLEAGLRFDGPALFCVYTAASVDAPHIHPYLRAAAGLDARAVPAFVYDPARGDDGAARFDLSANPQPDADWPVATLPFTAADGTQETVTLPFTFADALACDARFARHFLPLTRTRWHARLEPLADFVRRDDAEAAGTIPYVTMASDDGTLHRVAVDRTVARATKLAHAHWRALQEMGGIHNAFARRAAEAERLRAEAERQQAVAAAEARHQAELDHATGALAEAIVSNIAAGLLGMRSAEFGVPREPATRPATPPAQRAAPAKATPAEAAEGAPAPATAPAEVAEEEISFDEAYVETPRCTSCNECTNLNNRLFAYNADKQAFIKDVSAGTFRDLVTAAEKCPVHIIHPGKPANPDEPGLADLLERAEAFV